MDIEVSRAYAFILIPIILVFMYIVLKKFKNLKRKNLVNLISRILIIIFIVCGIALSKSNIFVQFVPNIYKIIDKRLSLWYTAKV